MQKVRKKFNEIKRPHCSKKGRFSSLLRASFPTTTNPRGGHVNGKQNSTIKPTLHNECQLFVRLTVRAGAWCGEVGGRGVFSQPVFRFIALATNHAGIGMGCGYGVRLVMCW